MLFFRSPEAEPFFLDNDAAGQRALYAASGLADDAVEEYVRVLTQPGAMTGAQLVPRRRPRPRRRARPDHHVDDVRVEHLRPRVGS
jgi:DNA primase